MLLNSHRKPPKNGRFFGLASTFEGQKGAFKESFPGLSYKDHSGNARIFLV